MGKKRLNVCMGQPVVIFDDNGDPVSLGNDEWELYLWRDWTTNDSSKQFNVPAGYEYQVLWIMATLSTTATVGTRQLAVYLSNPGGNWIGAIIAGATQAASLSRSYMFGPSLADLTAFRDTSFLMTPLPPTILLPANYGILVWDNKTIDAAADDLLVDIMVARRAL